MSNPEEGEVSRAEYIENIVNILGLDTELPEGYTAKDCGELLNTLGFQIKDLDNLNVAISEKEKSAILNTLINRRLTKSRKRAPGTVETATVDEVKGRVQAKREGTDKWIDVKAEMKFSEGDIFRTGPASFVRLKVGKFGRVTIKENSELSLKELSYRPKKKSENIILFLAHGESIIDVRDIDKESRFEVRTATTIAAVRGTIYSVKIEEDGSVTTLE